MAIVPAVIPLLLLLIPAILAVLSIAREKELDSITNLYVMPVTRSVLLAVSWQFFWKMLMRKIF